MPFQHEMKPYTKESILWLSTDQNGVYGIFRDTKAVYIGSGDIKERMLSHFNGDNPCITQNTPNQWTASVISGDPTPREGELIREYNPICNQVIPR
ncbi:GIY-YIG nuclease family protein [Chloroflexota bacterium]